jgi:hypothetical protein
MKEIKKKQVKNTIYTMNKNAAGKYSVMKLTARPDGHMVGFFLVCNTTLEEANESYKSVSKRNNNGK